MTTSTLTNATEIAADAWSAGAGAVADLASSAAGLATEIAAVAVGQFEDLPDKVSGLASAARRRISPAPKRSVRPWVLDRRRGRRLRRGRLVAPVAASV